MPDDHSKVVPPLPIPNRTVKRLRADDSGRTSVKVGHRQALTPQNPIRYSRVGFCFWGKRNPLPARYSGDNQMSPRLDMDARRLIRIVAWAHSAERFFATPVVIQAERRRARLQPGRSMGFSAAGAKEKGRSSERPFGTGCESRVYSVASVPR